MIASNVGGTAAYVKIFGKTSTPVPGTDVPCIVIPVPASSTVCYEFTALGTRPPNGCGYCIVGGIADTDATAVAANQVKVLFSFI